MAPNHVRGHGYAVSRLKGDTPRRSKTVATFEECYQKENILRWKTSRSSPFLHATSVRYRTILYGIARKVCCSTACTNTLSTAYTILPFELDLTRQLKEVDRVLFAPSVPIHASFLERAYLDTL